MDDDLGTKKKNTDTGLNTRPKTLGRSMKNRSMK